MEVSRRMDKVKILFCIFVNDDIRSIYCLSKSNFSLWNPDQSTLDALNLPQSAANLNSAVNSEAAGSMLSNINVFNVHILTIKPFIDKIESSSNYRKCIYRGCQNKLQYYTLLDNEDPEDVNEYIAIPINANLNDSYVIDYAWGWRLWRDCHIRLERECAAAWLSTLGGGFSALGDYSQKFASMAFQTSIQQIRLARLCEDDGGVARGWLFLALALSQLGYSKFPKTLLRRAWEHSTTDTRHKNMCLGVQVKLRYDAKMRRLAKMSGDVGTYSAAQKKQALMQSFKMLAL